MMWFFLILGALLACIAFIVYLVNRFGKFRLLKKLARGRKGRLRLLAFATVAVIFLLLVVTIDMYNAVISVLHLGVFWILCDLAAGILKRLRKKDGVPGDKPYYSGLAAILITICYLSVGWYLGHHVWVTEYEMQTDKSVGDLKVLFFADSHMGTTFSGKEFAKQVELMNAQRPDVVLIVGDFVDDDSSLEDMKDACEALSGLRTTYGVYYVFGNHDKGYYASRRGYNDARLVAELTRNGVKVLEDETEIIDGRFALIGRQDKEVRDRAPMEVLTEGLDDSLYSIVMNHQPNEYDLQAASGVDLVLSGHTHGGQMLPVNEVGKWTGLNDRTYGHEKRDKTDFIVTSGISAWAIKFKTGCKSEIVVVNIKD